MARVPARKTKTAAIISGVILLIILLVILLRSADDTLPDFPSPVLDTAIRGFTFLDLHADSILTEKVRNRLQETLGSVAVENRNVIDLEMHYPGFLEHHFPDLSRLNKRLNFEGARRVRIEHNATRLIFRYSAQFHTVDLFFSNDTRKPLLFRIKAKRDGRDYLATLQQKYGEPQTVPWQNQKGKSLFWTLDKDVMILSLFPDQYGQPQFEIMICHVLNIENLLAAEKRESGRRESEKGQPGRKLF